MIKDVSKSIKASMYERAISPLFGAFLISWVLWNYKTVLVLFSSMKVKEKIVYIESNLYSVNWSLTLYGAIYPLISAILFIIFYPFPAKWVYEYSTNKQKELKAIKQRIEDDTPLTLEESRVIRRELLRVESDYGEEIAKKNNDVDRYKDIILALENEIKEASLSSRKSKEPSGRIEKFNHSDSLNDELKQMLADIARAGGWVHEDNFLSESAFGTVKAEYFLEELESKGYVNRSYDGERACMAAMLTTKGKRFAVEEGIVS